MSGEVTLYDFKGKAIAYISLYEEFTIYMWDGFPVAYLYNNEYVYGFNGKHLGWFIDGCFYDKDGVCLGGLKEKIRVITQIEPIKGLKKIKPIKNLRELPRMKPIIIKLQNYNSNLDFELRKGSK